MERFAATNSGLCIDCSPLIVALATLIEFVVPNIFESTKGARRKSKRVGRGAGSTRGSTCGRGDKGRKSRSGGGVKLGFEGGQMPIQRRLPKSGFKSLTSQDTAQVRLQDLEKCDADVIDLETLKKHSLVPRKALKAKLIASGSIRKSVVVQGLLVSKGARAAIEAAQGTIKED